MIELIGLEKKFKDKTAIDNLSLKIVKGEILGLLGENGAGKTTTLRMLATMIKPTRGTAKICGYDIIKEPNQVRRHIGILFGGEAGLYDRLTARENIEYFAELSGMEKDDIEKRISEISDILDMNEFIDKRVGKFSKGMKQKVTIARSIIHNPDVMLLDEPTIGLDVSSTRMLQDFILNCKKQGKALIYSSHIMSEVEKLCDKIAIIHKGKLIDTGTIEGLKEKYNNNNLEEVFMKLIS